MVKAKPRYSDRFAEGMGNGENGGDIIVEL